MCKINVQSPVTQPVATQPSQNVTGAFGDHQVRIGENAQPLASKTPKKPPFMLTLKSIFHISGISQSKKTDTLSIIRNVLGGLSVYSPGKKNSETLLGNLKSLSENFDQRTKPHDENNIEKREIERSDGTNGIDFVAKDGRKIEDTTALLRSQLDRLSNAQLWHLHTNLQSDKFLDTAVTLVSDTGISHSAADILVDLHDLTHQILSERGYTQQSSAVSGFNIVDKAALRVYSHAQFTDQQDRKGVGYRDINEFLLSNHSPDQATNPREHDKVLDVLARVQIALTKMPGHSSGSDPLYRGLALPIADIEKYKDLAKKYDKNNPNPIVITDPTGGLTSTSTDKDLAKQFAGDNLKQNQERVLFIFNDKFENAKNITPFSAMKSEQERLVKAGTGVIVTSYEPPDPTAGNKLHVFHLQEVKPQHIHPDLTDSGPYTKKQP